MGNEGVESRRDRRRRDGMNKQVQSERERDQTTTAGCSCYAIDIGKL